MSGINISKIILTLITISVLRGDYYISFQYQINDYTLTYFNFECSKALSVSGKRGKLLFSLPCKNDVQKCCYKNKDKIVSHLIKRGVVVTSYDSYTNAQIKTTSKLTYLPKRFDIIIKNARAYFYIKGE